MLTNLDSMQSTLRDLKDIVAKNQGANHETGMLVRQMEQIVADIELKTQKNKKSGNSDLSLPLPHPSLAT
jgi:hypothetical protein